LLDIPSTLRFIRELRMVLKSDDFDLIHFFGIGRTLYLAGAIKATGLKTHILMTMVDYRKPKNLVYRLFERMSFWCIDDFIALCNYTKRKLIEQGASHVSVARPGVLLQAPLGLNRLVRVRPHATDLVLFWRDAEIANGVDTCIDAFKLLSGEFPSVDFVFAVRPNHPFEGELRKLDNQYINIHLLLFPYKDGITISELISSALCVVLPFRSLSCNPQLAVLETLMLGTPLVTTPVESNKELVENSKSVFVVEPSNIQETYLAVKYVLKNKARAREMAKKAKSQVAKTWNWQTYEEELIDAYKRFV